MKNKQELQKYLYLILKKRKVKQSIRTRRVLFAHAVEYHKKYSKKDNQLFSYKKTRTLFQNIQEKRDGSKRR